MSKPTISHGAIFLLLASLLCFGRAQARTWYVKADGGGDAIAIQPAIYLAESGDTILVAAGRYSGIDNRNIDYMEKSLVVRSESGPRVTIVDCTGEGRGFSFYNGETSAAKLEGFAIVNGHVTGGNGGGIDCSSDSSPTISGCILRNNRADGYGGGICCSSGSSPVISNCAVIRNRASYGGGIYCQQNASPQITNCIVVGDSAWSGGGIALIGGQPVLTGCVIVRNKAFFGAGIACSGSSPQTVITRCVVVSNLAVLSGGGINCVNAAPTINGGVPADRNSIYNNQASQGGTNLRTNTPLTNAQYNFWGRVNQTSEDSLFILDGIEIMGGGVSVNWWPMSTEPQTVVYKVKAATDTLYFPELTISFDHLTLDLSGDSTISVTAWPDSMPPDVVGGQPVEKWFYLTPGSAMGSFSANLTLDYTQAELDSSDITDEGAIYCARRSYGQWNSYPSTADPQENWVRCATDEFSIWAIGGPGGSLTAVPGAEEVFDGPGDFRLSQNYPNPFNACTTIPFCLPAEHCVSLKIFNVCGQQVKSLLDGQLPAGKHAVTWDGTDSRGRKAGSGLYFCRLQMGSFRQTGKLMLLR